MLIKSALVTQISGSIGGFTGAHNKGGMYLRSRSIPTNPQTSRQTDVRDMMSMYSQMWSQTLTPAERGAWSTYAENVPVIGPLGDTISLSGQQHYLRANVGRSAASTTLGLTVPLTSINDAPTIYDLPMLSPPTIDQGEINIGSSTDVLFDPTGWAGEPQNAILIYLGRPRNVGQNYFRGPYRLWDIIQGNATPPTSPAATTVNPEAVWPGAAAGQRAKVKFVLTIGAATTQPTGKSVETFDDVVFV